MALDPVTARRIASSRRELAALETAWGECSAKLLPAILNLADLYFALGEYAQSELLYSRYLTICCKVYGDEHPSVALGLRAMGEVYEVQGLYEEAERSYLWALNVREKAGCADDREKIDVLSRLLLLYRSLEQEFKAKVIEKRLEACIKPHRTGVDAGRAVAAVS